MSNLLLYVVLSSRTSFSLVTGKSVRQEISILEARLTLFEYSLIKRIDIGRFDVFSTILLESCKTIPDTRKERLMTGENVMTDLLDKCLKNWQLCDHDMMTMKITRKSKTDPLEELVQPYTRILVSNCLSSRR